MMIAMNGHRTRQFIPLTQPFQQVAVLASLTAKWLVTGGRRLFAQGTAKGILILHNNRQ